MTGAEGRVHVVEQACHDNRLVHAAVRAYVYIMHNYIACCKVKEISRADKHCALHTKNPDDFILLPAQVHDVLVQQPNTATDLDDGDHDAGGKVKLAVTC